LRVRRIRPDAVLSRSSYPHRWKNGGPQAKGNSLMMKAILTAAALTIAAASAALALPVSPTTQLPALTSTDVIQVGNYNKNYNKNYKHYNKNYNKNYKYNYKHGRYYYGNRYWGHRYNYRPYGWQTLGCVAVGPIWYCP
jgi:hypothetical protein